MTQQKMDSQRLDRSKLKPVEAECFPRYLTVRTDKPGGLVSCQQDLVGFEATNVVIRFRPPAESESMPENTVPHLGPLSLLFTVGGRQAYELDGRRLVVDESRYLIHNLGQTIASLPDF